MTDTTSKVFVYDLSPEVSGEAHDHLISKMAISTMFQFCPRDREEYWLQRYKDSIVLADEFFEKVARTNYRKDDFDFDNSIVTPRVHWLTNKLELIVTPIMGENVK